MFRRDFDEDQTRAEDGKWSAGGGAGAAKTKTTTKGKSKSATKGTDRASKIKELGLDANEQKLMDLASKRASDKKIMAALGMDRNQALAVANSLRKKLGVKLNETTREAVKRHGLAPTRGKVKAETKAEEKPKTETKAETKADPQTAHVQRAATDLTHDASKWAANSIGTAIQSDNYKPMRERLEKGLAEKGMTLRDGTSPDMFIANLPQGVNGGMDTRGRIALAPGTRDRLETFSIRWQRDPEGFKAALAKAHEDPEKNGGIIMAAKGMHTVVHEVIHGHGPLGEDHWEAEGLAAEELTTEVASRAFMRDNFGADSNKLHDKLKADGHTIERLREGVRSSNPEERSNATFIGQMYPSYQGTIDATLDAMEKELGIPRDKGVDVLERASVAFKKSKPEDMPSWAKTPQGYMSKLIIEAHGDKAHMTPAKLTQFSTALLLKWQYGPS